MPGTYNANPKAEGTVTSGQEITQCDDLPYVYPLDLLGYTFVHEHDGTDKGATVKEFLEYEVNFTVEYVNGVEELINDTNLINIFNCRN